LGSASSRGRKRCSILPPTTAPQPVLQLARRDRGNQPECTILAKLKALAQSREFLLCSAYMAAFSGIALEYTNQESILIGNSDRGRTESKLKI